MTFPEGPDCAAGYDIWVDFNSTWRHENGRLRAVAYPHTARPGLGLGLAVGTTLTAGDGDGNTRQATVVAVVRHAGADRPRRVTLELDGDGFVDAT